LITYEVLDQPKKISSEFIDELVYFAGRTLGIGLYEDIDITIEFESLKKHQFGFCDYEDGEATITIAKRLSREDVARTLFHEMVHVKQHMDGRLEGGAKSRWKGEFYDCDYMELPWEIEAFELEEILMEIFKSEHRL
jgi:hypothetical protein